jgi:PAB1-binding protein PBP1
VNEKKFGVSTDFKEELYTTTLDTSAPGFKEKERQAARIAREIEMVSRSNLAIDEKSTSG